MVIKIPLSLYETLGYDLDTAVDEYAAALEAFKHTVNQPAPNAPSALVENIVRRGETYEIIDDTPVKPPEVPVIDYNPSNIPAIDDANAAEKVRRDTFRNDSAQADLLNRLSTATSSQIDTWLTNNVTTLAQARTVLGAIVKFMAAKGLFR